MPVLWKKPTWPARRAGVAGCWSKAAMRGSTEYRVIDFADVKAVREIFSGSDNLGVAAVAEYLPDFRTKLIFARWHQQ